MAESTQGYSTQLLNAVDCVGVNGNSEVMGQDTPTTRARCLVLHRAGTIAERRKPRAEELEGTFYALLLSASGELFSLDKYLSWKSRSGKCRTSSLPGGRAASIRE